MNAMVYLLQVSACVGLFFCLYYLILSRLTFFTINRWYLMGALAFSFIIPLLTISINNADSPALQGAMYVQQLQNIPGQVISAKTEVQPSAINLPLLLWRGYLIIALALFIRLLAVIALFFLKIRHLPGTKVGGIRIFYGSPFAANGSFLHYIFLKDNQLSKAERKQIIRHEMLHVKRLHSFDRIILEMAKIILWFNPFIYWHSRAVEENHEFEVDYAIGLLADKKKYADLLLQLSVANQPTFYNSFNKTPLEKRITMLFNQPTTNMKKMIYVLVLPISAISCLAFANINIEKKVSVPGQPDTYAVNNPASGQSYAAYLASPVLAYLQLTASPFYSRQEIHKADGTVTIKVTFKLADGSASADLSPNDQLGIFIDGSFYNEEAIKKLPVEKTALLTIDRSEGALKREKIPSNGNYAVPFCFKTKDK